MIDPQTLEAVATQHFQQTHPPARGPEIRARVREWLESPARSLERAADFLRHVGPIEAQDLLDLGCGCGLTALAFARLGGRVSGVDTDPRLVDIALRLTRDGAIPAPALRAWDGRALPFPDSSFDAAYAIGALERAAYPERLLSEGSRVLRPCGRLMVIVPNRLFPFEPQTRLWGLPWLPAAAADLWARSRGRRAASGPRLRFHTRLSVLRLVRELDLPLRPLPPGRPPGGTPAPPWSVAGALAACRSSLAPEIRIVFEKSAP